MLPETLTIEKGDFLKPIIRSQIHVIKFSVLYDHILVDIGNDIISACDTGWVY